MQGKGNMQNNPSRSDGSGRLDNVDCFEIPLTASTLCDSSHRTRRKGPGPKRGQGEDCLRQERGDGAEDGQGEDRGVPSRGMSQCFGKSVAAELKTGKAKTTESHRAA